MQTLTRAKTPGNTARLAQCALTAGQHYSRIMAALGVPRMLYTFDHRWATPVALPLDDGRVTVDHDHKTCDLLWIIVPSLNDDESIIAGNVQAVWHQFLLTVQKFNDHVTNHAPYQGLWRIRQLADEHAAMLARVYAEMRS